MLDHGGDLDRARQVYGDGTWLDVSTGINPCPYPLPRVPETSWTRLPDASAIGALEAAAQAAYGTRAATVALAGAQAAIQLVPRLRPVGRAAVVGPTYNEHAAALAAEGWTVETVPEPAMAAGADLAVVVNPNNPDGRSWEPGTLAALAPRVGLLVVDESFADAHPELSLAPALGAGAGPGADRIVVLRSFGKFYGLAGLRLGFALVDEGLARRLRGLAGPWAVSGPALAIGCRALCDHAWRQATRHRLSVGAARLDDVAAAAGWQPVGGTALFRTFETADAGAAQARLARGKVWSRIFPYSRGWLRLGQPGTEDDWAQLEQAVRTR